MILPETSAAIDKALGRTAAPAPRVKGQHTSGRREDRLEAYITRPRKTIATIKGTITGPVMRAAPKRPAGVSARQWKKQKRRERREQQCIPISE